MKLTHLEDDFLGTLVFRVEHETVEKGNIYLAICAQIPEKERKNYEGYWHVKATVANEHILGTLIPGFTQRLATCRSAKILPAQGDLFL